MKALLFFFIGLGIVAAFYVRAGFEDITYPIAELGNCKNQEACFKYCNEPSHFDACIAFAESNDLLTENEIDDYRAANEAIVNGGPGGCSNELDCETYCSDINNLQECISFAEQHGLIDEQELEEARKVLAALEAGYSLPGGCTGEESCEAYCSEPAHMEECLTFAEAAGFMSEEEIAEARNILSIMQSGETPGGCQSQSECEEYCEDSAHFEECIDFAVQAGFMSEEEAEMIREMGGGEFAGPGGCTSEEECRAYCEQETNMEECAVFFGGRDHEEEEFDEDEPETYEDEKKYDERYDEEELNGEREGFIGPGGCVSEQECMAFCSEPANWGICISFLDELGEENGPVGEQEEEETDRYDLEGSYLDEEHNSIESYDSDDFETFDPGDSRIDFNADEEDGVTYEEIYIEGEEPQIDAEHQNAINQFFNDVLTKTKELLSI